MTIRPSLIAVTLWAAIFNHAQAKEATFTLTDPVTDAPLANTPYLMGSQGEPAQKAPLLTDAQGKTRPSAKEPQILVQAVEKGAPYLIFNRANNQGLCGNVNAQGYTHAYFMDHAQSWYDNGYLLQRQPNQSCTTARNVAAQLLSNDSQAFIDAYDSIPQTFVMNKAQQKSLLYSQIDETIKNKSININQGAAATLIERGVKTARSDKDDKRLNGIGYNLGFERKEYKRGLELLDEALRITPKDCYISNSKGYLLMRTGDTQNALRYFNDSDESCQSALQANKNDPAAQDYYYPITVNYLHLAENYALMGDEVKANDFFNRSLKIGSIYAKDEIVEVATHLVEQKILNPENISLLALYLQFVQSQEAGGNTKTETTKSTAKSSKKS
jgi:tetratricopeptide (TPR) repeat protein